MNEKQTATKTTEPIPTESIRAEAAIATRPASEALIDAGDLTVLEPGEFSDAVIRQIELRAEYKARVTKVALLQTSPSQWTRFKSEDGIGPETLYPDGWAAWAMFGVIGATWRGIKDKEKLYDAEKRVDGDGETYFWIESEMMLQGRRYAGFCGKRYLGKEVTRPDGTTYRQGFAKTEPDTMNDGFQNLLSRACRAVFGLGGRTVADIKTMSGLDLTNAKGAEFADHKSRTDNAEGWAIPFGKSKGTKLADATEKDIRYFIGVFEKDIADPAKGKYQARTAKQLDAFRTELERRTKPPTEQPAAEQPAGNSTPNTAQAEGASLDQLFVLIREEAAVLSISEKDVEAGLSKVGTIAQAEGWLKSLRTMRKKKEATAAGANEPGSDN